LREVFPYGAETFGPQSVAADIESQSGLPAPKDVSIAALVVIAIAIVGLLVWWLVA
jgi:hypothetical protein